MTRIALTIFDTFRRHRRAGFAFLAVLTAVLAVLVAGLDYEEDIAKFLPLSATDRRAMAVYQDVAGADKVIVIFQKDGDNADTDAVTDAIDAFVAAIYDLDTAGIAGAVTAEVDLDEAARIQDYVYARAPYFLTDADYRRIDSLLAEPDYITRTLRDDKALLMLPSAGRVGSTIARDPLHLFAPVAARLSDKTQVSARYELYNGYIFAPDMSRAIVTVDSPFGSSETDGNAALMRLLRRCARQAVGDDDGVEVRFTGGPVIAVSNADRIKRDSVAAVTVAMLLILALLFVAFRRVTHLLLIAATVGWGWLFAMAALALCHDSVSIIVIGISSVILGIAVNYPLHYIAHLGHTTGRRRALKEIVVPLVVGNITTVGAFLALVPLRSAALRDLGLFAAFLLIGTILFSVVFLPQLVRERNTAAVAPPRGCLAALFDAKIENRPALVWPIAALTVVLGWQSLRTGFDADMTHINYMTAAERADMNYFQREMMCDDGSVTVYAVSSAATMEQALARNDALAARLDSMKAAATVRDYGGCQAFVTGKEEQARRLTLWNDFVQRHRNLPERIAIASRQEGFAAESFAPFYDLFATSFVPLSPDSLDILTQSLFASCFLTDDDGCHVITTLTVTNRDEAARVEQTLNDGDMLAFDIGGINAAIADSLSSDFNYIGWACGAIVFLFLWLSFGSIELALLSFVPMAVSWLWILGIMAVLGIQFNIVNVILATFIFGQGDDYTIFMTEGACYEYAYRRRMLASYKHSIALSALIMFIGIGALIFARHPALRSLAEVTIAGMLSVVLTAWLLPPLIFRFLVMRRGQYRRQPLSFALLFRAITRRIPALAARHSTPHGAHRWHDLVVDRYRYKGVETFAAAKKCLRRHDDFAVTVDNAAEANVALIYGGGRGELALVYALTYPERHVIAVADDTDLAALLRYCAEGVADNIVSIEESALADALRPYSAATVVVYAFRDVPPMLRQYAVERLDG